MGRHLDSFTILKTRRADEMRRVLFDIYDARSFDLHGSQSLFAAEIAYCHMGSSELSYCNYGGETFSEFHERDYVRFQFCVSGFGHASIDGQTVDTDPSNIVCTPANASFRYGPSIEQVFLRINRDRLGQDLTSLLGTRSKKRISFDMTVSGDFGHARRLREKVLSTISTIDASDVPIPMPLLREIDQTIRIAALYGMPNNFTDLLNADPKLSAPWQVARIEEWIDAHWRESITIEKLVEISGASLRSIFSTFKSARGYTPMAYLKKVRLSAAHEMLIDAEPGVSVIAIGLACNFMSPSHFARDYKRYYGELPSETLQRARQHSK